MAVPAEAEDVNVPSICLVFRVSFLLDFFSAGEGWNGSWPLEMIQHAQAIISCLCVTVHVRTMGSCNIRNVFC